MQRTCVKLATLRTDECSIITFYNIGLVHAYILYAVLLLMFNALRHQNLKTPLYIPLLLSILHSILADGKRG